MSAEEIQNALQLLSDDPDNDDAWAVVEDVVATDGAEAERHLERARVDYERHRVWSVVARLLDFEVMVADEDRFAIPKLYELARIYQAELFESENALNTYQRVLDRKPDDERAKSAMSLIEASRDKWEETVEHCLEAAETQDEAQRARMLVNASVAAYRFGPRDEDTLRRLAAQLEDARGLDPDVPRSNELASRIAESLGEFELLAELLSARLGRVKERDARIGVAESLARLALSKIDNEQLALTAYQQLLDLDPKHGAALAFVVGYYSREEEWDYLAALYEDQLNSGAIKEEDQLGMWVQLAMLNWRSRNNPTAAEPYFENVRRAEPTHAGMLRFFREVLPERGDLVRLLKVLRGAHDAESDPAKQAELQAEIDEIAGGQENARDAIDQYKTVLRNDPDNQEAREKLRLLYMQTESYNALVEMYRQDLSRIAKDDAENRVPVLWAIAELYRDHMKSDTALLPVLQQIIQLDNTDVEAVRALVGVYESLGRWRDLLSTQQSLAELTPNKTEKVNLLRSVARRWVDQFSNVQNAIAAFEALLAATDGDAEAREMLRELYKKRRAWPKLYDLYESQLDDLDDDKRAVVMTRMAKLAAERLDRGADAIRLLKEVLVMRPDAEGVLDTLEKQSERQKDYATVAMVLERRVDEADDEKTKLSLLQKLGVLYQDKLESQDQANGVWRRVLDVSPGHKRAIRVLRQSYVEAHDWEGLEELYASQDDSEGLADFLSTTADRSKDPEERVVLSFHAARVYVEVLEAPERAIRSYERILSTDASNVRAAEELLPLYEEDEKWSRLPDLYKILLGATEDIDEKIDIHLKIAQVTGGPLANKAEALSHARQAYDLRPDEASLERLAEWSRQSGDWSAMIEVLHETLLGDEPPPEDRARELKLMLAKVYAYEISKLDEAVKIFRALVEADPEDLEVIGELENILRAADRRDDLRWLFNFKAERFEGTEKGTALEEWATVEEEVFGEPERAIELLQRVVEVDAGRASALDTLSRLLLSAERYEEAAGAMKLHRDAVDGGEERREIETALAAVMLQQLEDPQGAYDACARALEDGDATEDLVAILQLLVEVEATQAMAAGTLEQVYGQRGEHGQQVEALRAMLEAEEDDQRRLELCTKLADVYEHDLDDAGGAFDVILNTLLEPAADLSFWDRARDLCVTAGRPTDMAQAYRVHLVVDPNDDKEDGEGSKLAPEVQVELCQRAATLQEEQLGDPEGAVPYLARMLALEPLNEAAFERLKAIFHLTERWDDLEGLFRDAIEQVEEDEDRLPYLQEAAMVAEEMLDDDPKAIKYFERMVAIDALHVDAIDALERLYGREERYEPLAALLEQRLETSTDDEAFPIRLQLIDLYLHNLERHEPVLGHLEVVLRMNDDSHEAVSFAEECLDIPALRQPAAVLLDVVYEARDDIRDLVRVLEVQVEGAEDDEAKRVLLHRIGTLRDDRLKDDAGAFEALRQLMPLEPDDVGIRERLLEISARLGRHDATAEALVKTAGATEDSSTQCELLLAAATLFRHKLDDNEQAEKVLQRVIEIDPEDPDNVVPAAASLAEIYQEADDYEQLVGALNVQVRLVDDADEKAALHQRIATLCEDILEDDKGAIAAWQAQLENDGSDQRAMRALERLYGATQQWTELVAIMRELEQYAEESDERRRCLVKAAATLADELQETDEAIIAWRSVLDDFGPENDALEALSKLYRAAEQWDELSEIYDIWLETQDDPDARVELFADLGELRRAHLDDPHGALEAFRDVLVANPNHEATRAALGKMLEAEDPDVRREAAAIIGPLYDADGNAEQLLKVLDIEIESTFEPEAKLDKINFAMTTAEGTVGSDKLAFDYAARGVREALGEPDIAGWIDNVERFADSTERYGDLLDLYEGVVDDILDAEVQLNTRLRAGELARTMLDDNERSILLYQSALEADESDTRAMAALIDLYEETEDNEQLLEVLQMRAQAELEDDDRVQFLHRAAELQAGPLEARDDAIDTYEQLIELKLDPDACAALEKLYTAAERFDDLVAVYERQVDEADADDTADVRVKIAGVAHGHLSDTGRALDELGEALNVDPMHQGAIDMLEGMLEAAEEPDDRSMVAELLEPVYLRTADWAKLRLTLEARLETTLDHDQRDDLLRQLATLYEEQLEDYGAALETVAKRLRADPSDQEIWSEIERLGRVLGSAEDERVANVFAETLDEVGADDPNTAELAKRTGELYAAVDQNEKALKWYRSSYEFDPESTELFEAIDGLLVKLERSEERVEHYRNSLDHTFDDDVRVARLHVIGQLQRDNLGSADEAIDALTEVLDVDERNADALDALTELYKQNEKLDELAELYERRADMADDPEEGAPYRLLLAQLLLSREEPDIALDHLDTIVVQIPWHEGAIAELEKLIEDEERKQRVVDMLRPLYERANNWRGLIRLNEEMLPLTDEPAEKVDLLASSAQLWEDLGDDAQKAFDVLRQAFDIWPEEEMTRSNLERLADVVDGWDDVADSYSAAVEKLDDEYAQRPLLNSLAVICDEHLDDPRRAVEAWSALSELDPGESEPLERLDELCMLLGDWAKLVGVLDQQAENAPSDDERASLLRRLGAMQRDMLADDEGAVANYERALDVEPEAVDTLDALIALYDTRDNHQGLVDMIERRVEVTYDDDDLRHSLTLRAANRYRTALENPAEAIRMLSMALENRPEDLDVLTELEELYRGDENWDALLENLKNQAELAQEPELRATLHNKIGDLYIDKYDNAFDALEQYRVVLQDAAKDEHAIKATRAIAESTEELRLEVSALLEPVLSELGDYKQLIEIMELRLTAQTEPDERSRTLNGMALILEEQLDEPSAARDVLLRAIGEVPDEPTVHDDIERLCELTESWDAYADTLEKQAGDTYDAVVQTDLYARLGRVAQEQLGNKERAIDAYVKAVEQSENPSELLESLDALYVATENHDKLAEVLQRRVDLADGEAEQADLNHRLAVLQIEAFDDKLSGLNTLRMVVDVRPEHEGARAELEKLTAHEDLFEDVAEALDVVYRVVQDSAARAELRNKRIGYTPNPLERVRLRLELAQMLEDESFDTKSAQKVIEEAISDNPRDDELMAQLERLANVNADGGDEAEAWRGAASGVVRSVAPALESDDEDIRLNANQARDLYMRAAGWYVEHVADSSAAEKTLRLALEQDERCGDALLALETIHREDGREKDLVPTLRRIAELSEGNDAVLDRDPNELRREAKKVAADDLEDRDLAEEILREMLGIDDADRWALAELSASREAAEDWTEHHKLLQRLIELTEETDELRDLRHKAAAVAAERLDDKEGAINLYEQAFEDDSGDEHAADKLRGLYQELERFQDMLRFLQRLIEHEDDAEARAELRMQAATLCIETLEAPTEGIEHLNAVLDDVAGHAGAVELLGAMLEKEGRFDELSELLEKQVKHASETGDQDAELSFRVKLAELFESRLNDVERAIEGYRGVLETDGTFRPALEALARLYERQESHGEAAKVYQQLIDGAEADDVPRLALKARDLFVAAEDLSAASDVLEQVLESDVEVGPTAVAELRDGLRALYRDQESWQKLADLYTLEAGEAEGDDERVVLLRKAADIHIEKSADHATAAELLEKCLELKPEDRDLMLLLCDEYTGAGRGDDAIKVLQRVVDSYEGRRSKELADIHARIAGAHLASGNEEAALAELESARKMDPGSVKVLSQLGALSIEMFDSSDDDEAKAEHLKRAGNSFRSLLLQRLDKDSPVTKAQVFFQLGKVSQRDGDKKKAIQMLERAISNDKGFEPAKELLAEIKG